MRNRIRTSNSFDKRSTKPIILSSKEKQNTNIILNPKEIINKLSQLYIYFYSYYFPSILNFSKINFLDKINKNIEEAIFQNNGIDLNSPNIKQYLIKIKDNTENKYNKDYQSISTSYQEYINKTKKYEYIIHFRKHCSKTDSIALHPCSNRTQGKFILMQTKDSSSSYAICSKCKQCYKSDFILMLCTACNKKYYSTILKEKEDNNIFPATWEKYHCNTMVNEIMKCIQCHSTLYIDLSKKKLVCQNKRCNFISEPESIIWKCSVCKEDFRSPAKIYNPLEFQILRTTINIALLIQKKARPKELPCKCQNDLNKLTFFHKEECKGLLYQGMLLDKEVIVCSKCHAINFEEKFNWICPICLTKFYLHNVIGARPFSKKKYIINRELNKSESSSKRFSENQRNNVFYVKNDKYIEKRINNIHTKNINKEENNNEKSNKDILSYNENKNSSIKSKCILSRNKAQDNSRGSRTRNLRHYSTLKEILNERETSQSRNNKEINDKNYDKNKSQEITRNSRRIENVKQYYTSKRYENKNKLKMENYINSYMKNSRNRISSVIYNIEKDKINKNNKSPVELVESPKIINKFKSFNKAQYQSTSITTNKALYTQSPKENQNFNLSNYNTNNTKANANIDKEKNQLYSFKSWYRRSNPNSNLKAINSFRVSNNINDNNSENQNYQDFIKGFRNSDNYSIKESNSSMKYSILNQIKNINNFNINININTPSKQKNESLNNYSSKRTPENQEDINEKIVTEELFDKFEDISNEKFRKKLIKESLIINRKESFTDNIIITQEKLDILTKETKIPIFNETDYTFINEIGEGTYGDVYLVENNSTNEQYAMKKIICRDYNELIKHKKELELVFSVKHENILKLLGIKFKYLDETTGLIYVLMELAYTDWNKEIKRRILAKKYYSENELIDILKQIVKGFLYLEKKHIAHRDIKPQNILLFPNNKYKIADFGEAKSFQNKAQQSTLRGSELYMSPLLYKGYKYNQRKVVHNPFKSDAFSLGYCLLYAICLNLKVLESVRELSTLKSVINIINKYNINNRYSEEFMKLIYGMIEPNEEIRFDFEDLYSELNKIKHI